MRVPDIVIDGSLKLFTVITLAWCAWVVGDILYQSHWAPKTCARVTEVVVCNRYGCRVHTDKGRNVTTNALVSEGDLVCRHGTRPLYRLVGSE